MSAKTPAQSVAEGVADQPSKFYVPKKTVRIMIGAITQLQERPDLSGKFARKVGQNRRALSKADDLIVEERKDLTLVHAEKFPATLEDGVTPHPRAGEATPVYAMDQENKPIFKKDAAGNDTDERVIIPDQFNLKDPAQFHADFKELLDEIICIECPGFKVDDFNSFKQVAGKIIDPLMDLEVGGATTVKPEGFEGETAAPLALVPKDTSEAPVNETAAGDDTERSAP